MQLKRHLSSEERSETTSTSNQQHLRQTLSVLPVWARAATEHPDTFWEQQHKEIRKRIAAGPVRSSTPTVPVWVGALAMVLLAIFLLHSSPTQPSSKAQSDPDQELLVAVEQTVQSGVPQALEPAAMLADEISNSSQPISTSNRVYKENQNEDQ